jgi:hypothetical protein
VWRYVPDPKMDENFHIKINHPKGMIISPFIKSSDLG